MVMMMMYDGSYREAEFLYLYPSALQLNHFCPFIVFAPLSSEAFYCGIVNASNGGGTTEVRGWCHLQTPWKLEVLVVLA